jgi:hypothetical protein
MRWWCPKVQAKKKKLSRKLIVSVVALVVIVVVVAATFTLLTLPRSILESPVPSLEGGKTVHDTFQVPMFAGNVQVTVNVTMTRNAVVWAANITSQDGTQVWTHQAAQSDPQLYTSQWFSLPAGTYTLTFTAVGEGVLSAFEKVTTKGAIW